ncbi:MAG TPA: hypothetical protein VFX92_06365 [Candidatus Krumholzibacteria bacterium]|nr:hypothetical protein [Candidatus Krumholzibacteria bacterium]
MIERVIENWLTDVEERAFQVPFCQLLALQGHEIVHLSPHGPDEQGKDVITIHPDGTPCAYQLKVGDITLARWRQIVGEVEELLDIAIHHPSVDKSKRHRACLVVSGDLKDPVRRQIDDRNEDRRRSGGNTLDVLVKGQLLTQFTNASEHFLPREVSDLRSFLNLYARDGRAPAPRSDLAQILRSLTGLDTETDAKHGCRAAASGLLIGSYLIAPHEREKNWWAVADSLVIVAATACALAEKVGSYGEFRTTISLCLEGVERALGELEKEAANSPDLLMGTSFFDGRFVRYRATLIAGYLAALGLTRKLLGKSDWRSDDTSQFIEQHQEAFMLYSEAAFPCFLNIIWYLEATEKVEWAMKLLQKLINSIIAANEHDQYELMSPYYELESIVRGQMGLAVEAADETFAGNSYALDSLVTLAVRSGMRKYLETKWRPISRSNMSEFVPKDTWEYYTYRARHGELRSRFPNQTQSWKQLVEEAAKAADELPVGIGQCPQLLPLFLLVFPHRLRLGVVKYLDDIL